MRVVYTFFILLTALSLQAQETLITKTKIPLGLQVRHIETDSLIDISLLCDGFDENMVPKNLIIPYDSKVSLFLPKSISNDDVNFYLVDLSEFVTTIQGDPSAYRNTEYLLLIYKREFEFEGKKVLTLLNEEQLRGPQSRYQLVKQTIQSNGTKIYSDSTDISFQIEQPPTKIKELYLGSEIVEQIARFEWQLSVASLLEKNGFFSTSQIFTERNYDSWQKSGYIETGDSTRLPQTPSFPFDQNDLYFRMSRISSINDVIFFRNGNEQLISKDMILSNGMISLLNLKSGRYELIINNESSIYSKSPTIYEFTIKSSFWNQGGYWLAILLPLFLILFFIYRTYIKIKLNRFNLMKQLTEAELKAIRAQLNPHFLFNALNAIQNQVNKQNTEQANAYIAKLSRLMRLVLNQSAEPFHSLQLELEIAQLYLELEKLRFPFEYIINVPENLNAGMLVPTMLLQPYLENAVVHGVQAGGATSIYLTVVQQENTCTFKISDNGSGTSASSGNGKGMKMSSDRLKVIEQQHRINTSIKVRSSNDGYEVVIQIPTDL